MTHQYFVDCQNEMSDVMNTMNGDGVGTSVSQTEDAGRDSVDESVDWIPLSELSSRVNNRKNGRGGRSLVSAFRQLKARFWTRVETEDDSSGLLVDNSDYDHC